MRTLTDVPDYKLEPHYNDSPPLAYIRVGEIVAECPECFTEIQRVETQLGGTMKFTNARPVLCTRCGQWFALPATVRIDLDIDED